MRQEREDIVLGIAICAGQWLWRNEPSAVSCCIVQAHSVLARSRYLMHDGEHCITKEFWR